MSWRHWTAVRKRRRHRNLDEASACHRLELASPIVDLLGPQIVSTRYLCHHSARFHRLLQDCQLFRIRTPTVTLDAS
nr:hypothetical protein [Asticcacaulis sp.]